MNEVLSQDEIDQLLTAISQGGDGETDDFKPVNSARKIKIYECDRIILNNKAYGSMFIMTD